MTPENKEDVRLGRHGVWRSRGLRMMTGAHVSVSILLAAVLVLMVNALAHRVYRRWDVSEANFYELSPKTEQLLASLDGRIEAVSFFRKGHQLYEHVKALLGAYAYAASRLDGFELDVRVVDPDRDLTRTRELIKRYDVADADVVVFDFDGRRQYVDAADLMDYSLRIEGQRAFKRWVGFKGEQAFSSAILNISRQRRPTVYMLTGHGERNMTDFDRNSGYSRLARTMRRDNMEVKPLLLAESGGLPPDCDALILAGPDRRLADAELDTLSEYLDRGGRLLALLDPAVETGLEPLLNAWGLQTLRDVVVDPKRTLTGRELFVSRYGEHPITQRLGSLATVFYTPRSITPVNPVDGDGARPVDRPHATVLAAGGPDSWSEMDLAQTPVRFDEGTDIAGPRSVAVAVERGHIGGIDVEIRPTRMVVVGDSDFVSNGALASGVGGNIDFFFCSLNWLLERDALMAIAPKPPNELRLDMNRRRLQLMTALTVGAGPLALLLIGAVIWWRRRY